MSAVSLDVLGRALAPLRVIRDLTNDRIIISGERCRVSFPAHLLRGPGTVPMLLADLLLADPNVARWRWQTEIEVHPVFLLSLGEVLAT